MIAAWSPPIRLLLGLDSLSLWGNKLAQYTADRGRWRGRSEATAFADAVTPPVGG